MGTSRMYNVMVPCKQHRERSGLGHKCIIYQLCMCANILLLIVYSLLLLISTLAKIHTDEVYQRLQADIREENETNANDANLSLNLLKLLQCEKTLSAFRIIIFLIMNISGLCIVSLIFQIVGLTHDQWILMCPYMFIGTMGQLCIVVIRNFMYDNEWKSLNLSFETQYYEVAAHFSIMVLNGILFIHFLYLYDLRVKKRVPSVGGLFHTVDEVQQPLPKA